MENQVEQDPADVSSELAALKAEVARLSDRVKENQTGLFSAIRTLADDLIACYQGRRDLRELQPAVLGLVFAYLRPRLVIATGGLVALVIGILQLSVLLRQNKLIEQQGVFLEAQTRANQVSAITELVMALDPRDSIRSRLAQTQLARFGETGVDVLLDLSRTSGGGAALAAEALYAQGSLHSPAQARAVLGQWADRTASAIEGSALNPSDTTDALGSYERALSARARADAAFARELGNELGVTPKPRPLRTGGATEIRSGFPQQLSRLYRSYLARCTPDRSTSYCATPRWHHRISSLALNIRGHGPLLRLGVSDSTFHALVDVVREDPDGDEKAPETMIASWFLGDKRAGESR